MRLRSVLRTLHAVAGLREHPADDRADRDERDRGDDEGRLLEAEGDGAGGDADQWAALIEAGFEVIDESGLIIDLPARVETVRPDVILIDTESPGRDVMEQVVLVSRDQPRPIVMFTDEHDPNVMRQAIKSGVSAYIVEGIQAQRLQPILDVAMARFESDQALRAELQARDQQLAERKRIELAKGMLMKMKACNEEEAYTLMRRQAMSRQQKLIQVAEQIIAMSELLG